MKRALLAASSLLCLIHANAFARGVSPYLPLNLDPDIERQIERVLILADKPVLTRPIAAATVLDALPKACKADSELCEEVRRYLRRYMANFGVAEASVEVAASSGATKTLPNQHGLTTDSSWQASVTAFYQPTDFALISLGGVAYEGETVPTGSMISVGFSRAQLDIGYRDHWWSPMTDSSMLISTQAATMPSVTLSSYVPLTRFGFQYEAFIASMSHSDKIQFGDGFTSGHPRLAGLHLSMEPASGWAVGLNRILQYGGGERPSSFGDLFDAFFNPSQFDNTTGTNEQFGNQVASVTSQFLFPGKTPFTVYFEYAGEDTSDGKNYLLGNSSLSAGIHFPRLWRGFDLTYEVSEWQNAWYVNSVYGDGLTNKGHVIGNWFGDERLFGDAVGGQSHMVRVGWEPKFGGVLEVQARTLDNENYSGVPYKRAYDGTVRYSRPLKYVTVGAEVFAGRNVFGESFSRVGAFVHLTDDANPFASRFASDSGSSSAVDDTAEIFIDAGANANKVRIDPDRVNRETTGVGYGPHLGVGARRAVSDRSDLGARLEIDDIDGHVLLGVRAIDYRYRFANPLALGVFVGAARYDVATPAYGIYFGTGLQWRDVLPGWDVGLDLRYAMRVARDHLLPSDPTSPTAPDTFYDIYSTTLSLTRRF